MNFTEQQIKDIRTTYYFLAHESQSEVRLIDPHKQELPESYFIKSIDQLLKICKQDNEKHNTYLGINERELNGTTKEEVISVKTIVIDIDPKRTPNTNSTKEELSDSEKMADKIQEHLKENKIESFKAMSGNGIQLWIPTPKIKIDKKNSDEVENKIKAFHKHLAKKFESEKSKIDNIGDLPRIIKIIGTKSIKGQDTKKRPQRISYWVQNPTRIQNLPIIDYLDKLPTEKKTTETTKEKNDLDPKIQVVLAYDPDIQKLLEDKTKKKLIKGEYESYSEKEMGIVCRLTKYELSFEEINKIMMAYKSEKWVDAHEQYRKKTFEKAKEFTKTKTTNTLTEYLNLEVEKILIYPSKSESMIKMVLSEGIIELNKESLLTPKEFRAHYYIISGGQMLRDLKRDVWAKLMTCWTKTCGQVMMIEKGTEDQIIKEKIIEEIENFTLTKDLTKCTRYGKACLEDQTIIVSSSSIESIIKKNKWKHSLTKIAYWISEFLEKPSTAKRIKGKLIRCWFFKKNKLNFDYEFVEKTEEETDDNEEDD